MPGLPLWEEGRMMEIWTGDTLFFFQGHEGAMALYEAFVQKLPAAVGEVGVKVSKTQIAFANRCQFAFVSFAKVRRAGDRPENYMVITFGLDHREDSPRIHVAVEPYSGRWTHHIQVSAPEELDEELMRWLKEAAEFAERKGRGRGR